VLAVVRGPDELDLFCTPVPDFDVSTKPLRALHFPGNPVYEQDAEVTRLVKAAVEALAESGVEIVEADDDEIIEDAFLTLMQIVTADGAAWIRNLLEQLGTTEPHPWTKETLEALEGKGVSAEELLEAIDDWEEIRREMIETTRGYDLVVSPVVSTPTLPHGELVNVETMPAYAPAMLHNITGWPAVSVPVGLSSAGLPIGFQIAAKRWREADCLHAAGLVEAKLGGWVPPPAGDRQ
jgi:aspartyl-tRNA(Asn)/glutamyl-tRNA(Gln) amidotransferase subunit A